MTYLATIYFGRVKIPEMNPTDHRYERIEKPRQ